MPNLPAIKTISGVAIKKYAKADIKVFWSYTISFIFLICSRYFVQHLLMTLPSLLRASIFWWFWQFPDFSWTFYTNGKQPSCQEYLNLMIFWNQYFTCVVWQTQKCYCKAIKLCKCLHFLRFDSVKGARAVKLKLGFMEWFFYNLVILIKLYKIR